MLVGAAAARWGVPAAEISVEKGVLRHAASGREAGFGELAPEAAAIAPPEEPVLKQPEDFTLIGTRVPRLDSKTKTDGTAKFTLDVQRPGMLTALVAHPPTFGATVASFDDSAARKVPGVREVVQIPRGVAVVADSFWAARQGRDALEVSWDESKAERRGSAELTAACEQALGAPGVNARDDGSVDTALQEGERVVRRTYRLPYLAHATMEPMDCVVELGADRCDIWTASQLPTVDQQVAAGIAGLAPEQVSIHVHWAGGSFGRRAVPNSDFVAEAVMVAKAIGGKAPVKLMWTREDDMRGGFYRPMSVHELEGALDADGNIVAWRHRAAIQSILIGTPFESMVQDGLDTSAVEGSRSLPYAIPNLRVDWHPVEAGVPVLWWRSVGHTQNGFVTEAFFDELAAAAGKDPFELRRELLANHPRHRAVLELAAEKAGWGEDLGEGRGRGIAVHESFGSFVAEVVEVTVGDDGAFSVDRVVCAVDCGIAVNPDVIRAQMEGGIGYGLSAALREEITLDQGRVEQGNFDSYRPLRIDEMPDIEVHIVPSAEAPTGVGEPGTPPVGPALANALFAATGRRIERLPIGSRVTA
jgi:isoquinoline 1-oxidoreductase beta subunit